MYFSKNREEVLKKQKDNYMSFEDLVRNYVELENRIKTLQKEQ